MDKHLKFYSLWQPNNHRAKTLLKLLSKNSRKHLKTFCYQRLLQTFLLNLGAARLKNKPQLLNNRVKIYLKSQQFYWILSNTKFCYFTIFNI